MRDKRPVDELSIEELERILAVRKREARQGQLSRMRQSGRLVENGDDPVGAQRAAPLQTPIEVKPPSLPPTVDTPIVVNPHPPSPPLPHGEGGARDTLQIVSLKERGVGEGVVINGVRFDDDEGAPAAPKPRGTNRAARRWMDRVLLGVEVVAVLGIVAIGLNLLGAIGTLERETAEAQALAEAQRRATIPTLAPTPTLRLENFVLPGGHTLDRATGNASFNYAEVPDHLQPLVQTQWIQPVISRPAPTSETALSLIIPKLGINQAIVQGVDWEALKQGVGQLPNGVNPGDVGGNLVLAAHNDIYGELFRYVDQLAPGDEFQVQTQTQIFTYRVSEQRIVEPNEVSVLESRGSATATLISCYPYQVNDKRIVVFADRIT
jgi:sortase A